jgi:hypothetical protein
MQEDGGKVFNCIKCKDDKKIDQNLYVQEKKMMSIIIGITFWRIKE